MFSGRISVPNFAFHLVFQEGRIISVPNLHCILGGNRNCLRNLVMVSSGIKDQWVSYCWFFGCWDSRENTHMGRLHAYTQQVISQSYHLSLVLTQNLCNLSSHISLVLMQNLSNLSTHISLVSMQKSLTISTVVRQEFWQISQCLQTFWLPCCW